MVNILEKIHKAGLKFLVPLSPEETYKLITEEAIKLVKADYGSILLEEDGKLKRVYASSPQFYQIKPRRRNIMHTVYKTQKSIILNSKDLKGIAKIHPQIEKIGIHSDLITALSYRHRPIGVITIMSKKKSYFTQKEINILNLFAQMASLAISKTQLYDETKKALEARDLFISMAAHELRTPITTISGYSQLLYSKLAGSNAPESRWVTDLSWEALRLTYLVNELLEVDRIKTGQFEYMWKECSLREVIRRAVSDFRFTYPRHKIIFQDSLADSKKDVVIGDSNKLLQLVINLLDNAAKFSPPETEIVIGLKSKGPHFYLSTQDQGKGIHKRDLPRVFERFYQGTNHFKEGLGVGLFLVKNIVRQHRGTISISSRENRGTTVEVKLPRIKRQTIP